MSKRVSAKELKRRRQSIGTQEQVATALGISDRMISRFESGEKKSEGWYVLALQQLELIKYCAKAKRSIHEFM